VIKWIDEHGEPFLDKHTDVGMTAEKADALLKRHVEFEAIAKVSSAKSFIGRDINTTMVAAEQENFEHLETPY
jgi:hypothetical protein